MTGMGRPPLAWSTRLALHVGGSIVAAFGVAGMLRGGIGAGPADVFLGALAGVVGVAHGTASSLFLISLIVLAAALGHRPGVGTFAISLGFGPVLNQILDVAPHPDDLLTRSASAGVGLSLVALGVGCVTASEVGRGPVELCTEAVAVRTSWSEVHLRTGFEVSMAATGIALGGPFGPFTIVTAVAIGPMIAVGVRVVDGAALRAAARRPRLVELAPEARAG